MNPNSFHELYLAELEELHSAEAQMASILGNFAESAADARLGAMIRDQKDVTTQHRDLLDDLLKPNSSYMEGHSDFSMKAMIAEAGKWVDMIEDKKLKDVGIIASLQRMAHYEMAVAGLLAGWAICLGHDDDAAVLSSILHDKLEASAHLSRIAGDTVVPAAA